MPWCVDNLLLAISGLNLGQALFEPSRLPVQPSTLGQQHDTRIYGTNLLANGLEAHKPSSASRTALSMAWALFKHSWYSAVGSES